jgi:hypothetical protein
LWNCFSRPVIPSVTVERCVLPGQWA